MKARHLCGLLLTLGCGCNSILGIEQRDLVPTDGVAGTGGNQAGTAGVEQTNAGKAGSTQSGGTGGNAGATAGGGIGGSLEGGAGGSTAPDFVLEGELAEALAELDGFRFNNACQYVEEPGGCEKGSLCYKSSTKPVWSMSQQLAIHGDAAHLYEVTVRVRGVVEPHVYPSDCGRIVQPPPGKTIGIVEDCDGMTNRDDSFNTYGLVVDSPAKEFFFNAVPRDPTYRVEAIDLSWTMNVQGQSKVTFNFEDQAQAGQVRNCSEVVPDIPPAPEPFDGQFLQFDVIGAKILP